MDTQQITRSGPTAATTADSGRDAAISVRGLSKNYGQRKAVDNLTFDVRRGTVCGFVGPNGAGKTTTIRMLLGLIAPSSGTATVLGHSISQPELFLNKVGAMIEGPAFYPTLTARANLAVLAKLGGIDSGRGIEEVLDVVGLADRAGEQFRSFSLGMKQRLGLAAALLPKPELLLLDEPTNGLDPPGIREVRELMRRVADAGATVLVSSHLLDELQLVCDDVVIVRTGTLLFAGGMNDLIDAQRPTITARPELSRDLARLAELVERHGHTTTIEGDHIRMSAPLTFAADLNRAAMTTDITLVEIGHGSQSLEEIFFQLTDQAGTETAGSEGITS